MSSNRMSASTSKAYQSAGTLPTPWMSKGVEKKFSKEKREQFSVKVLEDIIARQKNTFEVYHSNFIHE